MADKNEETTLLARLEPIRSGASGDEASRAHYLLIVEGEEKGKRIPVGKDPFVIGRSSPAEVVLADPRISRSHCRVCVSFNEVIVIDLESSNGTFVDGQRITGGAPLPVGGRLQVGSHVFEHEFRNRKEVEESQELDRDIEQASHYIQSLLPDPIADGPVRADWTLVPCARLGGDAFGYRFIDGRYFSMYLIDVSGHGAGAAMHAVSVMNVLRQSALPGTDLRDPAGVLKALNDMLRMDTHGHMYLTVWYGVYDVETRTLRYASAGHHPSFLVEPTREKPLALQTRNPVIGVAPGIDFKAAETPVSPGSMLYVFSDGVFEIVTKDCQQWDLEDFLRILMAHPIAGTSEPKRLLTEVRSQSRSPALEDDFTLITFRFQEPPPEARAPDSTWPSRG